MRRRPVVFRAQLNQGSSWDDLAGPGAGALYDQGVVWRDRIEEALSAQCSSPWRDILACRSRQVRLALKRSVDVRSGLGPQPGKRGGR